MKWEVGWCRASAFEKSRAEGRAQFFTPFLAWLYFHSSPKVILSFLLQGWRSRRRMCGKGINVWSGSMGWEGCNERVRPAAEFLMFIITFAFLTLFVVLYFGLACFYILLDCLWVFWDRDCLAFCASKYNGDRAPRAFGNVPWCLLHQDVQKENQVFWLFEEKHPQKNQ